MPVLWSVINIVRVIWLFPVLLMKISNIINSDNIYDTFIHTPDGTEPRSLLKEWLLHMHE